MKKLYAIFGGNFDPIHLGHIQLSQKLAQEISLKKIIFLPNKNPPHKNTTKTCIIERIKMINLAIKKNPLFSISLLETKQEKIFYTVDTLKKIRNKIGFSKHLCFMMGEDNLKYLHTWKNWKDILLYCHLLIFPRVDSKINNYQLKKWVEYYKIKNSNLLYQKSYGFIFFSNINPINISSTQIRNNYFKGKNNDNLLPSIVNKYILLKKLYNN